MIPNFYSYPITLSAPSPASRIRADLSVEEARLVRRALVALEKSKDTTEQDRDQVWAILSRLTLEIRRASR